MDLAAEYIKVFGNKATAAQKGVELRSRKSPLSREKVRELVVSYRWWFEALLVLTLVKWRAGMKDARAAMVATVGAALEAVPTYTMLADRASQPFDFGLAAMLSRLVQEDFEPKFVALLTEPTDFPGDLSETPLDPLFDTCLLLAITRGVRPICWDKMIKVAGGKKKPPTLYSQSFQCYMNVIEAAKTKDWPAASALVQSAAANFEQRRNDRYFKQSVQMEAGGAMNDYVVDYRLATIVRACIPESKHALKLPHLWSF